MMPQIVTLCEQKIMAILQRFPLIECAWKDMLDPCQPFDCIIPSEVQLRFQKINLLIGAALNPGNTPEKRMEYFVRLMKECYHARREIERNGPRLDTMERNWARVVTRQLRNGIGPKTCEIDPKLYERDVFGGWNSCKLYEVEGEEGTEMDDESLRDMPVSEREWSERPLNRYSVPQQFIREYVARKGMYSCLLPHFTDGHPLNPVTRFFGQLGKYYQAAYTLLSTPVFPHPAVRSKGVIVKIRVVPVPERYFPSASTVTDRPEIPENFDRYVAREKERYQAPAGLYGTEEVQDLFRSNWNKGKEGEHCYIHPEIKLVMIEAVNFRYVRVLSIQRRTECFRAGEHRRLSQFKATIGASRDPCFACRAIIG